MKKLGLVLLSIALGAGLAQADVYNMNGKLVKVDYWAGDGASKAIVVIDFGPGSSFAFGYKWDGDASGWDALAAIDAAGAVTVDATWWPAYQAHFVNDLSYTGASKGDGESWGYYVSTDGATWAESWDGCDGRVLTDGCWDGWSWGYIDWEYYSHLRAPTAPVPEPVTLGMMVLGGAAVVLRRRAS